MNIQLTWEHRTYLIEMCQALFPEYCHVYWNSGKGSRGSDEHIGFGVRVKSVFGGFDISHEYVHWFELCMTHLPEKIFNPFNRLVTLDEVQENLKKFFWSVHLYWDCSINGLTPGFHPVNYLYREFKKLNNGKEERKCVQTHSERRSENCYRY